MPKGLDADSSRCTLSACTSDTSQYAVIATLSVLNTSLKQSRSSFFIPDQIVLYCLKYICSTYFHCPLFAAVYPFYPFPFTSISCSISVLPISIILYCLQYIFSISIVPVMCAFKARLFALSLPPTSACFGQ